MVLQLMVAHSKEYMAWASRLGTNVFPLPGHGDMPWIEAIDLVLQVPPSAPSGPLDSSHEEVLLRGMALACLLFSTPAREVIFSDSRLVYHLLQTKPPMQSEVRRILPLLHYHVMQWAAHGYRDTLQFVQGVREDWMYGTTIKDYEERTMEQDEMELPLE